MNDKYWMQQAYLLAKKAQSIGEVPVGAVVVSDEGKLLGSGYNKVLIDNDPTAHAEIIAMRDAAKKLGNYRLLNTTMYVTLEPCTMCAGALVHARVKRLVFASRDFKAGAAGSVCNVVKGYPYNHQLQIDEGVMSCECAQLLTTFFSKRRD